MVNILVPAWKEGALFKDCLNSILNLNYPEINVVVNAGGNELTQNIAKKFKEFENFTILQQLHGKNKAALGKIKALNECLPYISKGLVFMIDADVIFTDDIFLRMIYPIVNFGEKVVSGGVRPLKSQENVDLVKYIKINRNPFFREKFTRYGSGISGANSCVNYDVIKKIGKFNQDRIWAEDRSRSMDILGAGFKIYLMADERGIL